MAVWIAAIIKDEHRDIREWVAHNEAIGITGIELYDDASQKPYEQELGDYLLKDFVNIRRWHGHGRFRQRAAYNDFTFRDHWSDNDWGAFIDPDEFIRLHDHQSIDALISAYPDAAGLGLSWQCYGADGHVQRPALPVQEAYTTPIPLIRENHNFKSIARLNAVAFWNDVHRFTPRSGKLVNTKGEMIIDSFPKQVLDVAHIDHYITKSWEDYLRRLERGNITHGIRKIATFFAYNPDMAHLKPELTKDLDPTNFPTTQTEQEVRELNKAINGSDIFFRLKLATAPDLVSDQDFSVICVLELLNFAAFHLRRMPDGDSESVRQKCYRMVDQQIAFLNSIPRDVPDYRNTVVETIASTPFPRAL